MQSRILYYGALFVFALTACSGGGTGSSTTLLPGGASNQSQLPTPGGVHITEYSLTGIATPGYANGDGAILPDGSIWLNVTDLLHVTNTGVKISSVSIFDPTCTLDCTSVNSGLTYHASNNSLWYGVLHTAGTLYSEEVDWIDATTGAYEGATDAVFVGTTSKPVNGSDGRVWTTGCNVGFDGATKFCNAVAINPSTSVTTTYDLGAGNSAPVIAPSAHGFIYVFETDQFDANPHILELSTGGRILNSFALPNATVADMAEGADGNLWILAVAENEIVRMTPSGSFKHFPVPSSRADITQILRATDGNMWFTETNTNKIGRVTPSGTITEFSTPTEHSAPNGIFGPDASTCAISPHGFFYITESTADAIARVDF